MNIIWKGQGTLVAHVIKTPESGSATWIHKRIHELKSSAYHDLGFIPYSLRGVTSKDTDIPNRFQAGIAKIIFFLKYFFANRRTIYFFWFHTSDFYIFISFSVFFKKIEQVKINNYLKFKLKNCFYLLQKFYLKYC